MTTRHLEWLNLNAQRTYPLREDVTRRDISDNFTIPNELLVDAVIAIDTEIVTTVFIKRLVLLPDIVTILLHNQEDEPVGSCTVIASTHTENDYYPLQGSGFYLPLNGKLVIGTIPDVVGTYEFNADGASFEQGVLIPNLRGVSTLGIYSSSHTQQLPLEGHTKLIPGFNIRLLYDYSRNGIRIDAIEGAGLGTNCVCPVENEIPGEPIKFINAIPGSATRNFNVQGVGCIAITGIENGIKIENTCEEPCCDCDDVQGLQAVLTALEAQLAGLDGRVLTLENC